MSTTTEELPTYTSDTELADAITKLANALAGRAASAAAQAGAEQLYRALATHPSAAVRRAAISRASLGLLRELARDPEVQNRRRVARSPWNLDLTLQQILATDRDGRVVQALIEATDPYAETVRTILAGPHRRAKLTLIATKNLRNELLELAARDADAQVARAARRALVARRTRQVASTRQVAVV